MTASIPDSINFSLHDNMVGDFRLVREHVAGFLGSASNAAVARAAIRLAADALRKDGTARQEDGTARSEDDASRTDASEFADGVDGTLSTDGGVGASDLADDEILS